MADKLEDPSVAYVYAGFDTDFTLFKYYTKPITDPASGEVGVFEQKFKGYLPHLEQDSDPIGWLRRAAVAAVRDAVRKTKTMSEMWIIEFSPVIVEKFPTLPSHLFLDRQADREFLSSGVL